MAETKEKLDRLRAKRGGHRGVCTKLTKETDEIVHATVIDYDRCEVIRALLEGKSKILNDIDEDRNTRNMRSSKHWGRNRGIDRGYGKNTRCKTKVRQSKTQHEGHGSDEHFNGDDFE